MRWIATIALFCTLIILSGCSNSESYYRPDYNFAAVDKIAVINVVGPVGGEAARNQISDFFNMELIQRGYDTIERSQIHELLKEQKFQASSVTSDEGAAQAGRILNVPVVMLINVPKFDNDIQLSAKMIDVETGSILWMGNASGSANKMLGTIIGAAAGAAVGVASTGHDDRVVGGIAGGAIGGLAGNMLTPDQATKMRELTKKVCQNMPARYALIKAK
jgi:hypothetical protein